MGMLRSTRRALLYRPPAAGGNWWEVSGQTCIAAYAPKGAANLAASYVNLANPGTYDAAPGTAPSFAAATGWTFVRTSLQYLTTGITPANGYSIIARFSNGSVISGQVGQLAGCYSGNETSRLGIMPLYYFDGIPRMYYQHGGLFYTDGIMTSGVMAAAGSGCYMNGTSVGTNSTSFSTAASKTVYIGAQNGGPSPTDYFSGDIQALAIYSTTLSASDVTALTDRMNAL